MQCHALYLWLWPRPGGMRLQLGETRRVAGQRHQRTLPVVTPAWPSPGASARRPRAAARAAARASKRRASRWKKCSLQLRVSCESTQHRLGLGLGLGLGLELANPEP